MYRLSGAPPSWRQSLLAACLWAGEGGTASHRAAAALWQLEGFSPGIVEIVTPRPLHNASVIVHRGCLPERDVTAVGAIPTTTVVRTLIDLGTVVEADAVERALDDALRRRLVTPLRLQRRLRELGRRQGTRALRSLLADRSPGPSQPESVLETRLWKLLRRSGLPHPVLQHEVREGGRLLARVDFAWPDRLVAVEADGYAFHGDAAAWRRDLGRRNELTARGWRVVHVTWNEVSTSPRQVVATIRRVLESAG
ncbi:MAG: endonuclease domain-containing protein [Actinomycetota bacterium]